MEYIESEAWKELRKLVSVRRETLKTFSNEELHGLTGQMKRCTVSIPSNIEVECGCGPSADTLQSPHIFKQSLRITSNQSQSSTNNSQPKKHESNRPH